jgi:hypothetical protein
MKQLGAGLLFIVVGLFCGIAIATLNTAFEPTCGEDCTNTSLASLLTWTAICVFSFPSLGLLVWSRTGGTYKSLAAILSFFSIISVLPAISIYGHELHRRYWEDAWKRNIPNIDFSWMVIATKSVTASSADETNIQIKAWERCALGTTNCEKKPLSVEAICLGSRKIVIIDESIWPAFQRIQDEDLPGLIDNPKDMNLCENK